MKAETKERSMKRFLLAQKNIVYTDPIEVRAGKMVTVLYNPSSTVLSGKPDVWIRYSFNRWTHRNGPLPPQKMEPADNGTHLKATGESFFAACKIVLIFITVFLQRDMYLVIFGTINL